MEIISGKDIAYKLNKETKQENLEFIKQYNHTPKLVAIIVGDNPASEIYVASKQKKCQEIGFMSEVIKFDKYCSESDIINLINKLNNDQNVDAILLQLPLPKHLNERKIINKIDKNKDVDGLTDENLGKIASNTPSLIPCTAKGIMKMLENEKLEGKNAVVIGRSLLVGKPTAMLLSNQNATVTLCHSKTQNLENISKNADILVVAVGKPNFIKSVKSGCIIIDVGINKLKGKTYGDVDFDCVKNMVSKITPVPGGVGPMTIAMLMKNTLECAKLNINK